MPPKKCVFCDISSGKQEAEVLYRDDEVIVIKDIKPVAPVHLLLIPCRHVAGLTYASGSVSNTLGKMFALAEEMARRQAVTVSGYRLVVNQGPDSGQQVEHLHMHLLGGRALKAMG
jgi:histidine triad (HIT) family protein